MSPRSALVLLLALALVAIGGPLAGPAFAQEEEEDLPEGFIPPFDSGRFPRRAPDENRIQIPEGRTLEVACQRAEKAATAGDWGSAAKEYLDVLRQQREPDEGIQKVGRVSPGRWYSYARIVRERLHAWPEEGRTAFRAASDAEARALYDEALARGDVRGLEQVWRTYPVATVADDALERLGDIALEAGEGGLAVDRYERAIGLPGRDVDPKRIEAKISRARKLVLESIAAPAAGGPGPSRWPVTGGDSAHAAALPPMPGMAAAPRLAVPLPPTRGTQLWGMRSARRVRFEGQREDPIVETLPVADQGKIILGTANSIYCYDLASGDKKWQKQVWPGADPGPNIFYGATIDDGRVFAPFIRSVSSAEYYRGIPIREPIASRRLVALELTTGKVLWDHAESLDPFLRKISVGLPPIARGGVLFATGILGQGAASREGASKCYLMAVDAATGRLLWRRYIGAGQVELTMFGEPAIESLFSQPAEEGGTIYLASGLGHAAAVNATTGEIEWLASYETIPIEPARTYYPIIRGLPWRSGPPVVAHGTFLLTPMDAAKAYAFDTRTGETRWTVEAASGSLRRLLGVHEGRAIFQGDRLHAYDMRTGKLSLSFPRAADQSFGEEEAGRGLICGGAALVPLPTRIARVDLKTGERLPDIPIPGGIKDSGSLLFLARDLINVNPQRASVFNIQTPRPPVGEVR